MTDEVLNSHIPVYLPPEQLEKGRTLRPHESAEQHQKRVEQLAALIEAEGQLNPIRIQEREGENPLVLAGDGRRDALVYLNNKRKAAGEEPLLAWCVIDTSTDPLRRAIIDNFARVQNTPLEVAELMHRVREQHGWKPAPGKKGEGANRKLADYFGLQPSEVTQYEKLLSAPDDIKARVESGEMTMSAAITLLKVGEGQTEQTARDVRKQVVEKAKEIAVEEESRRKPVKATPPTTKAGKAAPAATTASTSAFVKPVKVTASHVAKAAAAVTSTVVKLPTRRDIIDAITAFDGPLSSATGKAFVQAFVNWAEGKTAKTTKMVDAWEKLQGGNGNGKNGKQKQAKAGAAVKPVKNSNKQVKAVAVKKVKVKTAAAKTAKAVVGKKAKAQAKVKAKAAGASA